jgi:hypothetical protein
LTELRKDQGRPPPVMEDSNSNVEIIQAMSFSQLSTDRTWSADFIKGKGEGIAVLLHGLF